MQVEDSELLGEFLSEQAEYSADLKAMVLLMVEKQQGNIRAVSEQTGIGVSTIYQWLSQWNARERENKKKA
jgi:transposase-like protein